MHFDERPDLELCDSHDEDDRRGGNGGGGDGGGSPRKRAARGGGGDTHMPDADGGGGKMPARVSSSNVNTTSSFYQPSVATIGTIGTVLGLAAAVGATVFTH